MLLRLQQACVHMNINIPVVIVLQNYTKDDTFRRTDALIRNDVILESPRSTFMSLLLYWRICLFS